MATDAIDFLVGQHQAVEKLIDAIKNAAPDSRGPLFDELRESLAVHETAEELVLRPLTRSAGADGERVASERMAEENDAKQALADLEKMDAASDDFLASFGAFASDVLEHATKEEQEEFPLLRRSADAEEAAEDRWVDGEDRKGRADPSSSVGEDDCRERRAGAVRRCAGSNAGRDLACAARLGAARQSRRAVRSA